MLRLGRAARRALAGPSRFHVLAVFRRTFYAQDAEGRLVCVGPPAIGDGPLSAIAGMPGAASWDAATLAPGARGESDGSALRVGPWVFALSRARPWSPPPLPAGWDLPTLERGLRHLAAMAATHAPADGLGRVVPLLAAGEEARTPLLARARPAALALAGWLGAGRAVGDPPGELEALIGLGPGLTPSGDDFLGGALVAVHALGRPSAAARLADWLLPRARARTHAISLAHLACAAEGEAMAPLHAALRRLVAPDAPGLSACVRAVGAVGHTSGWDALAGAWVAATGVAGLARGR